MSKAIIRVSLHNGKQDIINDLAIHKLQVLQKYLYFLAYPTQTLRNEMLIFSDFFWYEHGKGKHPVEIMSENLLCKMAPTCVTHSKKATKIT